MTICAAVMCKADSNEEQGMLFGISDRMITWGGKLESEWVNQTKCFAFSVPTRIIALCAGDLDVCADIALRTQRQALSTGITDVEQIARLFSENFARLRRERAERLYLSPLGLDMDSFIASQQKMQPSEVANITDRLLNESLGVEAIIAGVDSGGPHIYSVGTVRQTADGIERETSEAACHDGSGFRAIGAGSDQFEMQFQLMGYDRAWSMMDSLLLAAIAKKQAEMAPGVGATTDIFAILSDKGLQWLPREAINLIEGCRAKYQEEVGKQRIQIASVMKERIRFNWGAEGSSPGAASQ